MDKERHATFEDLADGVAEAPDGSLYTTDSQKGKIWRVMYQAEK